MHMNDRIVTERGYVNHMSRHSVYEWEDIFCEEFSSGLFYLKNNIIHKLKKHTIAKNFHYRTSKTDWKLAFVINASNDAGFRKNNIIPIYIDFPSESIKKVVESTRKLPVYFVTNYQIYMEIRTKYQGENCFYVPLTVADQYFKEEIPEKEIDVVQVGRKNPVLHEYMLDYCKQHGETEYVYAAEKGEQGYVSTKRGPIGRMDTRQQYMELLRKAKVSLVSSPACDSVRNDFKKEHDFITPRFYESAAAYCWLIGRYSENEDAAYQGLNAVCPNTDSYRQFSDRLTYCLATEIQKQKHEYEEFIKNHLTSKMVWGGVIQVLKNKGFE